MTLLVVGQTGQLALELARAAPEAVFLPRTRLDLSDPDAARAALSERLAGAGAVSAVINAAAYTAVDKAEEEEELAQRINGASPTAMAELCTERGVPFVHVSTDYVFDGAGHAPRSPDAPTAPLGAYGRTKLVGEEGVRAAGGAHAIIRTAWVVSAHGKNFVKTMLRLAATRDALRIVEDQVGGPTPAADLAQACLGAARGLAADASKAGTYHYSGAPEVSWADFAREIFRQAGLGTHVDGIPTSEYPTPAARPLNSRLDCTSFEAAFGVARPDWRVGLAAILSELAATEGDAA